MNRLSKITCRPEASSLKIPHTDPNIHSAIIHRLLFHLSDARIQHRPLVIVCIGTDRSTGDCLGPLSAPHLHATTVLCFISTVHWTSLSTP